MLCEYSSQTSRKIQQPATPAQAKFISGSCSTYNAGGTMTRIFTFTLVLFLTGLANDYAVAAEAASTEREKSSEELSTENSLVFYPYGLIPAICLEEIDKEMKVNS